MNTGLLILFISYVVKITGTSLAIRFIFPRRKEFEHIYWIWDFITFKNISSEYIPLPIEIAREFAIGRIITSFILGIICGIPMLFTLNTIGALWMIGSWLMIPQIATWLWSEKKLIYMALLFMVFL